MGSTKSGQGYGEVKAAWLECRCLGPCRRHRGADRGESTSRNEAYLYLPTAGKFLSRFGVIPVRLPWEDIEGAMQPAVGRHRLVHFRDYTVGWASSRAKYFLTNNISRRLVWFLLSARIAGQSCPSI
jgi:hypothetical protein